MIKFIVQIVTYSDIKYTYPFSMIWIINLEHSVSCFRDTPLYFSHVITIALSYMGQNTLLIGAVGQNIVIHIEKAIKLSVHSVPLIYTFSVILLKIEIPTLWQPEMVMQHSRFTQLHNYALSVSSFASIMRLASESLVVDMWANGLL